MACGTLFLHLALLVVTVRAHSFHCGVVRSPPRARIIGGSAAQPHAYPWMVKLLENGNFICGGSIVSPEYIITATHCIEDTKPTDVLEIVAGAQKYRNESSVQRIRVSKMTPHPQYNTTNSPLNDIAVLKLSQNLTFTSNVSAICLPEMNDTLPSSCIVAGWGSTIFGKNSPPEELQEVTLTAYSPSACNTTLGPTIRDILNVEPDEYLDQGVMCAADDSLGGRDACQGDSGGPLFCLSPTGTDQTEAYYLFGVVSWGFSCRDERLPGFYAYVPYFNSWITDAMSGSPPVSRAARAAPAAGGVVMMALVAAFCLKRA